MHAVHAAIKMTEKCIAMHSRLHLNHVAGCLCAAGALVMPLMAQGFKMGLVKFVLITGTKPQQ